LPKGWSYAVAICGIADTHHQALRNTPRDDGAEVFGGNAVYSISS
jgi:hypothetical protein